MPTSLENLFGVHETALQLRSRRAQVLSANLANADTPHYKARDLDFRAALRQAREGAGTGAVAMRVTHSGHMAPAIQTGGELLYRVPTQPSVDGNTVDAQEEHAAFMDNAIRYQATLRFINGKAKGLISALKGE